MLRADLSDLVRLTGGDLDGENRTRIMVCITMDSHGRDIVQKLIREKVSDATEFQWQSQLKSRRALALTVTGTGTRLNLGWLFKLGC